VEAAMLRAGVRNVVVFVSGLRLFLCMEVEDHEKISRILENGEESIRSKKHTAPMTENVEGKKHDSSNFHRAGSLEVYHWENNN
tara:strand:+ start:1032 stop:1283 length:252 start_codon:yes stop_codon:yes gene_type:complete